MYSACLFCHADLGRNEAVEHFTVGRRLAFDSRRGRLWVVCTRCAQWNLTPLEERWEAVEECERLFRDTRLRISTDNIGLARVADGTHLVRIGEPQRPELAAWRYSDRFGRRRRETLLKVGLGVGVLGAAVAGGVAAGAVSLAVANPIFQIARWVVRGSPRTVLARLPFHGGRGVQIRRSHLGALQLRPGLKDPADWRLHVPTEGAGVLLLTGAEAMRITGLVLPAVNRFGGSSADTQRAVSLLDGPDAVASFGSLVRAGNRNGGDGYVTRMPGPVRLALEMAAHEEQERRAMEGELAELERAWQEAEEIAAIADDMFLPAVVTDRLRRLRGA